MQLRPHPAALLTAALAASLAVLPLSTASADEARLELPAGGRATGELTAGESHLYAVRLVRGTHYSVRLTGRRGLAPTLELLDRTRSAVDTGGALRDVRGAVVLRRFEVGESGTYLLRVAGDPGDHAGADTGVYHLRTSRHSPSATPRTVALTAGGEVRVPFDAAADARISVSVRRARGSAAVPRIVSIADDAGAHLDLARSRETQRRALARAVTATGGEHAVVVTTAADAGDAIVVIRVRPPRTRRALIRRASGAAAPDFAYFAAEIQPLLQSRGCGASACHGGATGQGRMKLLAPPTGDFTLEQTYWNYFQLARWVELGNPGSRVVVKPLAEADGGIFHGGGDRYGADDPEHARMTAWATGATLLSLPPTAHAGADVTGQVGATLTLDATRSRDPEDDPLSYEWSLLEQPADSSATLDSSTAAEPRFVPDRAGAYVFALRVVDASGVWSESDTAVLVATESQRGSVVDLEAEHATRSGAFVVIQSADASAGAAITADSGGEARLRFRIDDPGPAAVWGRVRAAGELIAAPRVDVTIDGFAAGSWTADSDVWTLLRASTAPFGLSTGEHELVVTTTGGAAVDRILITPADLEPADRATDALRVRRFSFDTLLRSPTPDEQVLAPFLDESELAADIVGGPAYYRAWWAWQQERTGLVGRYQPRRDDEDFAALATVPARLANGTLTEPEAFRALVLSAAWGRRNPITKDVAYALFEEFLGRPPELARVDGEASEYERALTLARGQAASLFGVETSGAKGLADVFFGLSASAPDYGLHRGAGSDRDELARAHVLGTWRRFVPDGDPDGAALTDWTARYAADAHAIKAIVTEMLSSPQYAAALDLPRRKTSVQYLRGLYMDVLRTEPSDETLGLIHYAYGSSGDDAPVNAGFVGQLVASPQAAPLLVGATTDPETWLRETFVALLGRLPTTRELTLLSDELAGLAGEPATPAWVLEALLTCDEYQGY